MSGKDAGQLLSPPAVIAAMVAQITNKGNAKAVTSARPHQLAETIMGYGLHPPVSLAALVVDWLPSRRHSIISCELLPMNRQGQGPKRSVQNVPKNTATEV